MSNIRTYYDSYEAEDDGVIYGGLTDKWTYKKDALLLTNVTIRLSQLRNIYLTVVVVGEAARFRSENRIA